jgi:hypothetical protein
MFMQGLRIAEGLRARLFEEAGGTEVTLMNIERLLKLDGEYLQLQAKAWRRCIDSLDDEAHAPLEYPLGAD